MTSFRAARTAFQPATIPRIAGGPLSEGLVVAMLPHLQVEAVTRRHTPMVTGTPFATCKFSKYGRGRTNSSWIMGETRTPLRNSDECTLLVVVNPSSNTVTTFYFALASSTSDTPFIALVNSSTSSFAEFWVRSDSSTSQQARSASTLGTGTPVVMAGTRSVSANAQLLYRNGAADGPGTTASSLTTTVDRVGIGGLWRPSAGLNVAGDYYLGLVWDRALSAAEIAEISADPYQVFAQPMARIYSFPAPAAPGGSFIASWAIAARGSILGAGRGH